MKLTLQPHVHIALSQVAEITNARLGNTNINSPYTSCKIYEEVRFANMIQIIHFLVFFGHLWTYSGTGQTLHHTFYT